MADLWFLIRCQRYRLVERFWFGLAWLLPCRLVYFATIRACSHATTGEYAATNTAMLPMVEMLRRIGPWAG